MLYRTSAAKSVQMTKSQILSQLNIDLTPSITFYHMMYPWFHFCGSVSLFEWARHIFMGPLNKTCTAPITSFVCMVFIRGVQVRKYGHMIMCITHFFQFVSYKFHHKLFLNSKIKNKNINIAQQQWHEAQASVTVPSSLFV